MRVICISGRAQHGKDTVAGMMREELLSEQKKVRIIHYADLLKHICKSFFDWNGEKDEQGRALLQYIGTDVIRRQNPNFWVDYIATMLEFFEQQWDYVIIPDVRFPNEIERLREHGFDVTHLRVVRKNFKSQLTEEQMKHPSETAMDNQEPDYLIENDGSLEQLKQKTINWVKEYLNERR